MGYNGIHNEAEAFRIAMAMSNPQAKPQGPKLRARPRRRRFGRGHPAKRNPLYSPRKRSRLRTRTSKEIASPTQLGFPTEKREMRSLLRQSGWWQADPHSADVDRDDSHWRLGSFHNIRTPFTNGCWCASF